MRRGPSIDDDASDVRERLTLKELEAASRPRRTVVARGSVAQLAAAVVATSRQHVPAPAEPPRLTGEWQNRPEGKRPAEFLSNLNASYIAHEKPQSRAAERRLRQLEAAEAKRLKREGKCSTSSSTPTNGLDALP